MDVVAATNHAYLLLLTCVHGHVEEHGGSNLYSVAYTVGLRRAATLPCIQLAEQHILQVSTPDHVTALRERNSLILDRLPRVLWIYTNVS